MFDVGFSELVLLFIIGLLVLGPEKLPRVANTIGRWLGQARRMTRALKRQIDDELELSKVRESVRQPISSVLDKAQEKSKTYAEHKDDESGFGETGHADAAEESVPPPQARPDPSAPAAAADANPAPTGRGSEPGAAEENGKASS